MKKIQLILLLVLGSIAFNSCSDDDKQPILKLGDLLLSSQEFLTKYFPDNKVVSVNLVSPSSIRSTGKESVGTETESTYAQVLLEGDINVFFSYRGGNWIGISSEKGIPLSATKILDEHVYDALIDKEPQAKITILSPVYDHSIAITLDNKARYAQTQLLAYSGTTLAEMNITDTNKTKIVDFLTRNAINESSATREIYKITEREGTAYRLFIANALTISFDENANWIHAEVNEDDINASNAIKLLSEIAKKEIPASVTDAIVGTQNNLGGIRIIAVYDNGNYGFRFKNKDLLVNKDTGIVPPTIAKANGLISKHYDSSYKLREPNGITLVGAYEYFTSFYYVKDEKTVDIEVSTNGDWRSINEFIMGNGKAVSISLPPTIVDELPALTVKYLEENYKDKAIYYLSHNQHDNKGYVVYVDKRYQLSFNEDGSFKSMIEVWY